MKLGKEEKDFQRITRLCFSLLDDTELRRQMELPAMLWKVAEAYIHKHLQHEDIESVLSLEELQEGARLTFEAAVLSLGRNMGESELPLLSEPCPPEPLQEAAYQGIIGEFLRLIEPETEAHPAAILLQLLVGLGNRIGRSPFYRVSSTRHHTNIFLVICGNTARARKGHSWEPVKAFLRQIEKGFGCSSGLSSGEGLISQVADEPDPKEPDARTNVPGLVKGVSRPKNAAASVPKRDKRLLVIESEFGSALSRMQREGNSLSAQLRDAWDTGDLQTMTKNSPLSATGAHISVIGHITQQELQAKMSATDHFSGLANRFIWIHAYRTRHLPFGGHVDEEALTALACKFSDALQHAKVIGQMHMDAHARRRWEEVYSHLDREVPGLLGAVTTRACPIVIRLAMIYALMDFCDMIGLDHLEAALGVWRYAEESARYIFGHSPTGNADADEIYEHLKQHPDGMTKTEISAIFNRKKPAAELKKVVQILHRNKLVILEKRPGERQSVEVLKAVGSAEAPNN